MVCKGFHKYKNIFRRVGVVLALSLLLLGTKTALAQPFGVGVFDANVPFGAQTSLSIATGGNVTIQITPSGTSTLGTGSNAVTITSTDVVGYKLYLRALSSTNLTNGTATIPASGNVSPATLSVNTWGYNTNGTTSFSGVTATDALIKSATGPFSSGDTTTFTYGVKIDNSQPSGSYVTTVVYTAVPQTT